MAKTTFKVHVRIDSTGRATALAEHEIDNGTTLDGICNDLAGSTRDIVIEVTASVPDAPLISVDVPEEQHEQSAEVAP